MKTKNLFQIFALLTLLMGLLPPQTTTYAASEANELNASALYTTLSIPYISEFSGAPTQNYDCGPATVGMLVQAFGLWTSYRWDACASLWNTPSEHL